MVWWFDAFEGYFMQKVRDVFTERACLKHAVRYPSAQLKVIKLSFSQLLYKLHGIKIVVGYLVLLTFCLAG
jgi:hypothetical protein